MIILLHSTTILFIYCDILVVKLHIDKLYLENLLDPRAWIWNLKFEV